MSFFRLLLIIRPHIVQGFCVSFCRGRPRCPHLSVSSFHLYHRLVSREHLIRATFMCVVSSLLFSCRDILPSGLVLSLLFHYVCYCRSLLHPPHTAHFLEFGLGYERTATLSSPTRPLCARRSTRRSSPASTPALGCTLASRMSRPSECLAFFFLFSPSSSHFLNSVELLRPLLFSSLPAWMLCCCCCLLLQKPVR